MTGKIAINSAYPFCEDEPIWVGCNMDLTWQLVLFAAVAVALVLGVGLIVRLTL